MAATGLVRLECRMASQRRHTCEQLVACLGAKGQRVACGIARPLIAPPLERLPRPIVYTLARTVTRVVGDVDGVISRRGRLTWLECPKAVSRISRNACA